MKEDTEYNPYKNPKAIAIWQAEDGNFEGECQRNGKMVSAREIKPEDVLIKLLTEG